jgi:UDP-N-acetylmuramoyl-tripeptide--D-alanyl-D-alanine ligase
VLGEMRELGDHSADEHARIGRLATSLGIDVIVVVGEEAGPLADAARDEAHHSDAPTLVLVDDADGALRALCDLVADDDAVLVKGSRAVGLEAVAHALARGDLADGTTPAPAAEPVR